MAWLTHARASSLISQQMTSTHTAAELRVHGVGRMLLDAYDDMARTSERERHRLARGAAGTSVGASVLSGAASAATFGMLARLVATGRMPVAAAVTVVVGIRSGAASVSTLLTGVNRMFEESLYVRDRPRRDPGHRRLLVPPADAVPCSRGAGPGLPGPPDQRTGGPDRHPPGLRS
ncbi:hypothetical protein [Streptomyces sp. NBC_01789]|uniref:hypothetical protein n=1 Tax=Streptomyces sp. NBC_01789 TaxID=2975941 RepID=UPI002253FC9A|nr:hypothetical protein [Streptomyces sp. NBC_01789]MCX4451110.1 hypothetical protein [Streptomyces sp. NBC_01789]